MQAVNIKAPGKNSSSLKLPCRYTSQMTRKKKTWQDGYTKIFATGNSFLVQLFDSSDLRDQSLEGRLMTIKEAECFRRKELVEMTMGNHMIEFSLDADSTAFAAPVKIAKFKAPSVLPRPPVVVPERNPVFQQYSNNTSMRNNNYEPNDRFQQTHKANHYENRVYRGKGEDDDKDLDDLWNTGQSNLAPSASHERNQNKKHISSNEDGRSNEIYQHQHQSSDNLNNNRVSWRNANEELLHRQSCDSYSDLNNCQSDDLNRNRNNQSKAKARENHSRSSSHENVDQNVSGDRRKRQNCEVSGNVEDNASKQSSRRPSMEPAEYFNVRGSMKRVDASMWDD